MRTNKEKKAVFTYILVPLWFGLLSLPFLGIPEALKLSLGIFMVLMTFRIARNIPTQFLKRIAARSEIAFQKMASSGKWTKGTFAALLLILPLFLDNYQIDVMTMAGLYVALALGLNVVVGFAGLLDLGYAAFYAVGAYCYALLSVHFQISFWIALPMAGILAGCFGFLLGVITLRLRGDYLAIVTLGFIQILHLVLNNWDTVTRGPKGILGIPHPRIGQFSFNLPIHYYYLIFAIVVASLFFMQRVNGSRIGRAWDAIREDEIAAEAMGIHTTRMKILAFVIGAAWAGICGTFFSAKFGFVSPESFTFFESILILSMVVLGGIGSIPGVILGAVILIILPEVLRGLSNYRMLLFGSAMILMMVLRPQGILGHFRRKVALN